MAKTPSVVTIKPLDIDSVGFMKDFKGRLLRAHQAGTRGQFRMTYGQVTAVGLIFDDYVSGKLWSGVPIGYTTSDGSPTGALQGVFLSDGRLALSTLPARMQKACALIGSAFVSGAIPAYVSSTAAYHIDAIAGTIAEGNSGTIIDGSPGGPNYLGNTLSLVSLSYSAGVISLQYYAWRGTLAGYSRWTVRTTAFTLATSAHPAPVIRDTPSDVLAEGALTYINGRLSFGVMTQQTANDYSGTISASGSWNLVAAVGGAGGGSYSWGPNEAFSSARALLPDSVSVPGSMSTAYTANVMPLSDFSTRDAAYDVYGGAVFNAQFQDTTPVPSGMNAVAAGAGPATLNVHVSLGGVTYDFPLSLGTTQYSAYRDGGSTDDIFVRMDAYTSADGSNAASLHVGTLTDAVGNTRPPSHLPIGGVGNDYFLDRGLVLQPSISDLLNTAGLSGLDATMTFVARKPAEMCGYSSAWMVVAQYSGSPFGCESNMVMVLNGSTLVYAGTKLSVAYSVVQGVTYLIVSGTFTYPTAYTGIIARRLSDSAEFKLPTTAVLPVSGVITI